MSVVADVQTAHTEPTARPRSRDNTNIPGSVRQLGFWSALLTAVFAAGWPIGMVLQNVLAPVPAWQGPPAAIAAFEPLHQLSLYPSLAFAPAFVVLLACLHLAAPDEQKVWSLSGLAIGTIYATMATINYQIQLVAVQPSIERGETAGIELFLMANPRSVFAALASSYVYMGLAMLLTAPVFTDRGLERWIRRLFVAVGLMAPVQLAYQLLDLHLAFALAAGGVWSVGVPVAATLLAVRFKHAEPASGATTR